MSNLNGVNGHADHLISHCHLEPVKNFVRPDKPHSK